MENLSELSVAGLKGILSIKEKIEGLQLQLERIAGNGGVEGAPRTRRVSAVARRRMSLAQRARRARGKGVAGPPRKRRRMSAAGRARIRAAVKAPWDRYRKAKA
jgi:hypothetical protein